MSSKQTDSTPAPGTGRFEVRGKDRLFDAWVVRRFDSYEAASEWAAQRAWVYPTPDGESVWVAE